MKTSTRNIGQTFKNWFLPDTEHNQKVVKIQVPSFFYTIFALLLHFFCFFVCTIIPEGPGPPLSFKWIRILQVVSLCHISLLEIRWRPQTNAFILAYRFKRRSQTAATTNPLFMIVQISTEILEHSSCLRETSSDSGLICTIHHVQKSGSWSFLKCKCTINWINELH